MPIAMLWKLQYATPDSFTNAGAFATALRQHLQYTSAGLLSVLLQIGEEQSAYLLQTGCPGCVLDRCLPGCRVALLRRVLAAGYAQSELSLVKRGLLRRPYTRAVIGWPSRADAQPLDASVLQGWKEARLQVHWRRRKRTQQGLQASVVLQVGDGADDPLERLRAVGWQGRAVPSRLPGVRGQPKAAPCWAARAWMSDPFVLTPVAATTHWLMTPPTSAPDALDAAAAASYGNAAALVQHLHEAGARVEMLDLEMDGWTADVAMTTTEGGDPRPIWDALMAPGAPLEVRDRRRGTVALDPALGRPSGTPPPLLLLGTRPNGPRRWRPLDSTHHLVLSGAVGGGIILGMVAPAVQSRADLRVGVLDLTTQGTLDVELLDVPGRLPTTDGRNPHELVGAIGSLPDREQPVLVVLAADDAATAEEPLVSMLRAALYRPVSVLLAVPSVDAIPAVLRDHCPVVATRQRVAQWQVPEGRWEWARPTVLRLPWREPRLSWPLLPRHEARRAVTPLQPLDGFWAVPLELDAILGTPAVQTAVTEEQDDEALPETPEPAAMEEAGADSAGIDGPLPHEVAMASGVVDPVPETPVSDPAGDRACLPPEPGRAVVPETACEPVVFAGRKGLEPTDAPMSLPIPAFVPLLPPGRDGTQPSAPLPLLPSTPSDAATATLSYTPREDSAGKLIIEPQLLALTLQWAEQTDFGARGVPLTRFHRALGLPTKAHSTDLLHALRLQGLIRREVREGWYRLLTVEEAVTAGKLPPGPWYRSPVELRATPDDGAEPVLPATGGTATDAPATPPPREPEPTLQPDGVLDVGDDEVQA